MRKPLTCVYVHVHSDKHNVESPGSQGCRGNNYHNTKRSGHFIVYMQELIYPAGSKGTPKAPKKASLSILNLSSTECTSQSVMNIL